MILAFYVALLLVQASANPIASQSPTFSENNASQLLNQITLGLVARNQNQVLGAFDLRKMQNGALFRQQIVSFIAHADNIRVYFHVMNVSGSSGKGAAQAEIELEAEPRESSNAVPVHKQDRLHLTAESTPGGWKITEVQPRSFFSLQP